MGSGSMGGGASQNGFIGMAMGQASKLFDQQSQNGNLVRDILPFPSGCLQEVWGVWADVLVAH